MLDTPFYDFTLTPSTGILSPLGDSSPSPSTSAPVGSILALLCSLLTPGPVQLSI